jgi:DNA-binding transcriptional ArsR family regulator
MGALTDRTVPTTEAVRSAVTFSPLVLEGEAAVGIVVEGEEWTTPAVDPLVPTTLEALHLPAVLHALSDPVRLRIVLQLSEGGEQTCGALDLPVAKSTCSHHFRVLREAGVVAQRVDGKCRYNRLRADELEQRFPGLLDSVLRAQSLAGSGQASDPARA